MDASFAGTREGEFLKNITAACMPQRARTLD